MKKEQVKMQEVQVNEAHLVLEVFGYMYLT